MRAEVAKVVAVVRRVRKCIVWWVWWVWRGEGKAYEVPGVVYMNGFWVEKTLLQSRYQPFIYTRKDGECCV